MKNTAVSSFTAGPIGALVLLQVSRTVLLDSDGLQPNLKPHLAFSSPTTGVELNTDNTLTGYRLTGLR